MKILLIAVILIVCIGAYFLITDYNNKQEIELFYDNIKNISDIENKSDIEYKKYLDLDTKTNDQLINNHTAVMKTIDTETSMLNDLKDKLTNETLKEYVDIQINRLNTEKRYDELLIEDAKSANKYINGEITLSERLDKMNSAKSELSSYGNKTTEYKMDADSFLSLHKEIKEKFDELGIDEDFLYAQLE